MLSRWRSFIILIAIFVLWELFALGTAYLGLHTLRRVAGALLIVGIGGFVIRKKTALASVIKAMDDAIHQHRIWPWTSMPGLGLKTYEVFVQAAGWMFVLFGILGVFGIIPVRVQSLLTVFSN